MFPRVLVETAVLARPVFHALIWPLLAAMAIYLLGAAWLAWRGLHGSAHEPAPTTDVDLSVNNHLKLALPFGSRLF